MFGFSLSKLLLTVAIVVAVWYGFKLVGRLEQARKARLKAASKGGGGTAAGAIADLERCPACSAYLDAESASACGRDDCPFPG